MQIHNAESQLDAELLLTREEELCFAVAHDSEEVGQQVDGGAVVSGKVAYGEEFAILLLGHVQEVRGKFDTHLNQSFGIWMAVAPV